MCSPLHALDSVRAIPNGFGISCSEITATCYRGAFQPSMLGTQNIRHAFVLHFNVLVVPFTASHALPVPTAAAWMEYFSLRTPPPQLFEQFAPCTFQLALQSAGGAAFDTHAGTQHMRTKAGGLTWVVRCFERLYIFYVHCRFTLFYSTLLHVPRPPALANYFERFPLDATDNGGNVSSFCLPYFALIRNKGFWRKNSFRLVNYKMAIIHISFIIIKWTKAYI